MMPQEQVFFTDHAVYISNTRLVLRKGGTYLIANLAQVSFGRVPANRSWIGFLFFGFVFLALRLSFSQNSTSAVHLPFSEELYLVIGGSLLLIGFVSLLFQLVWPLYVVILKGTFGTAKPIKRRGRRNILKVVAALNEAISRKDAPAIVVHSSTHVGNVISGIHIGDGAQANIGTYGNATNVKDARPPTPGLNTDLRRLSNEAQTDLRPGAWKNTGKQADQSHSWSVRPADQPVQAGMGTRKFIIIYSHEDRQWLDLLRVQLAPLVRQQMIAIWDNTQITAGMLAQQAMTDALKAADFALLLVSANFLASDVIMRHELPQILQRQSQGRITLLPLILSPCLYDQSPLKPYQPFNPNDPLLMLSDPEKENMLARLAQQIQWAVS